MPSTRAEQGTWTFLTNHAHVLVCLARDPDARLRDVASDVGITERAVQGIVRDLEDEGYLDRVRVGRRNHYDVHLDGPMRHPMDREHAVGTLVSVLGPPAAGEVGNGTKPTA